MTSIPLGSAGYPGQGWRAQLEGSPQAGLRPKGRACIPQNPLPRFLIISPPSPLLSHGGSCSPAPSWSPLWK